MSARQSPTFEAPVGTLAPLHESTWGMGSPTREDPGRASLRCAPIEQSAIAYWLTGVPALQIDGARCASAGELRNRIASFWLADEKIVYIGKAASLRFRGNANC